MAKKVEKFADNPGLPANEHAKQLAKAESFKKKQEMEAKQFKKVVYTRLGNKVLEIAITPKGAKSTYMGNVKKDSRYFEDIKDSKGNKQKGQISKWKDLGIWINQDDFEEACEKIREELYQESLKAG